MAPRPVSSEKSISRGRDSIVGRRLGLRGRNNFGAQLAAESMFEVDFWGRWCRCRIPRAGRARLQPAFRVPFELHIRNTWSAAPLAIRRTDCQSGRELGVRHEELGEPRRDRKAKAIIPPPLIGRFAGRGTLEKDRANDGAEAGAREVNFSR